MVRQLALKFLYQKKGEDYQSENPETSLALGFGLAESMRENKKITGLAFIALPFWIVQVAETESILLSAIALDSISIEVTENRALGAIKRIISSATSEPGTIPDSVSKALELLGNIEQSIHTVQSLIYSSNLINQSNHYVLLEPTEQLNRLDETIDSQKALDISSRFQKLLDESKTRLAELEELRKFSREHLREKVTAIENVFTSERDRWSRRVRTHEEITELEISELQEKKQDSIYDLDQKFKIGLRAITADFTRILSSLEDHFENLAILTRDARITIGQTGECVEDAFSLFDELVQKLETKTPEYQDVIKEIRNKTDEISGKIESMKKSMEEEISAISSDIDAQIRERKLRLVEFDLERSQKENEMADLQENAKLAVSKFERALEERIESAKIELNRISDYAFNNSGIKEIAPLTHLDVEFLIVSYHDETISLFTPGVSPSERVTIPIKHQVLSSELDKWLKDTIERYIEQSRSFKDNLHTLNVSSSMLLDTPEDLLKPGLRNLQARQLLTEGLDEKLILRWNEYMGKCPDCGSDVGPEAQFCGACGRVIR